MSLIGAGSAPGARLTPNLRGALWMLASALLFALAITGMKVMARGHSPFTLLVYAAGLGLALFHEAPSPVVLEGAAIVVASTLFISWREHQLSRRGHD